MRAIALMIAACLLCGAALASEAGWICLGCGRENPQRANFCGGCRTARPTASVEIDANANGWVCADCGAVCPDDDAFCMICGADHSTDARRALLIEPAPPVPASFPAAQIVSYQGRIDNGGVHRYAYTVPTDGVYRVFLDDAPSGFALHVRVLDRQGEVVNAAYFGGKEGVSAELKAGEVYTLEVEQYDGTGDYTLMLGVANPCRAIDGITRIADSAVFEDQVNAYEFTAPFDGVYGFTFKNLLSGLAFRIAVYDSLGYLQNSAYMANEECLNVELEAGERYRVEVTHYSALGEYTLEIGLARGRTDISGLGAVGDTLSFQGERVEYTYTAQRSGRYALMLGLPNSDETARVTVLDVSGYRIDSAYLSNMEGMEVDLEAPQAYVIQVEQYSGFDSFTLSIGD